MTPLGEKLRQLRDSRGVQLKDMAAALKVSPAYLSALEHGHRGRPSGGLVQQISAYFNLAWDDVDELKRRAEIPPPRVVIAPAGLTPQATELANRLAERIGTLDGPMLEEMLGLLESGGHQKT